MKNSIRHQFFWFFGRQYLSIKLIIALFLFFSTAHHLFSFFERPAWMMIGVFFLLMPVFIKISSLIVNWIIEERYKFVEKRLLFFLSSAVIFGVVMAIIFYATPISYHTLIITPELENNESFELLEIKVDKDRINFKEVKIPAGWTLNEGVLSGSGRSETFEISFKDRSNLPITFLIKSSTNDGMMHFSLDRGTQSLDMRNIEGEEAKVTLYSQYRGIPNFLFSSLLFLSDLILFSMIIFFILLFQDNGSIQNSPQKLFLLSEHKKNLTILIILTSVLHSLNALSVPLLLSQDTHVYLDGAISFLATGSFQDVPTISGPGWVFLFAPIRFLFQHNPWGMKLFLHLFAMLCVPLAYRLAWHLGQKKSTAFLAGFVVMLSPDLMQYSNYFLSDLINLFMVFLFSTFLISALQKNTTPSIALLMIIGVVATSFRAENVVLLLMGTFFVFLKSNVFFDKKTSMINQVFHNRNVSRRLISLSILFFLALLPSFGWSFYKYNYSNYDGVRNYTQEVIYTGWIYYGDASHLEFSDQSSNAISRINDAIAIYPAVNVDKSGIPTGWKIYSSLIKYGYSPTEAMNILGDAAWDSIFNDWRLTLRLTGIKLDDALSPEMATLVTMPLPTEDVYKNVEELKYFNVEALSYPVLINNQRRLNKFLLVFYKEIYPYLVKIMVIALLFSIYKRPSIIWIALITVILIRFLIPNLLGLASWRYTLVTLIPLQVLTVVWLDSVIQGIRMQFLEKQTQYN